MNRFVCVTALLASSAALAISSPYPGVTLVDHPEGVLAIIDLCAPGVSVRSTRYVERQATPQQWGQAVDAEVAMNGDFFQFPGWSWVSGRARGAGEDWPAGSQQLDVIPYWQFGPGSADYERNALAGPAPWISELLAARDLLIDHGVVQVNWPNDDFFLGPHKRTALGISGDRQTLYMMVTRASVGFPTVGTWMRDWAAEAGAPPIDLATNLDGGGSSQLYVKGLGQIVDSGRQVTNHLGIYAKGGGTPNNCRSRSPRSNGNVASWGPGRLDVVTWGADEGLGHRGFGLGWGGWDKLGGKLGERPVINSWGPNRLDIFTVATDRSMNHYWWDGAKFSGPEPHGGSLDSEPAVTSWGPNRIDLFAVGTDRAMYHKAWTGLAWTGWENLGGQFAFKPAVVAWGNNRLDVFAVAAEDHSLQHLYWNGSQFSAWENLGGKLESAPQVVAWSFDRLDIFGVGAAQQLFHRAWTGFAWGGWDALGGQVVGDPSVVAWGPNRLDVFAQQKDGTMGHLSWNGAQFSAWEAHVGQIAESPVAISWETNRLDIFSVGVDRSVVHKWWNGAAWSGWESLGSAVKKPPVAMVLEWPPGFETAPVLQGPASSSSAGRTPGVNGGKGSNEVTGQVGCSVVPGGEVMAALLMTTLARRRRRK